MYVLGSRVIFRKGIYVLYLLLYVHVLKQLYTTSEKFCMVILP